MARLGRLNVFKTELRRHIAGASLKGIRKALSKTPKLPPQATSAIESEIRAGKQALTALNKTIGTLEYYSLASNCGQPLSQPSYQRLQAVGEKYAQLCLPGIEHSRMGASLPGCDEILQRLRARQARLIDAIAAKGPHVQAIVDDLTRDFDASIGLLQSKLQEHELELAQLSRSKERVRTYCASEERPSIVSAAVKELASPIETQAKDNGHPAPSCLTVFWMPNGVMGDIYNVGQAGAVGAGATAANMTLTSTGLPLPDDSTKLGPQD